LGNWLAAQICLLPDGRKLAYTTVGKGYPVVNFHGTASSRLEVLLIRQLADSGLQLIGVDRPGYGLSTYKPRRNLGDFNGDLNCLADHLGLEKFAVLGWSGGGAFALAYLTHNPRRVSRAVVISAPCLPFDVSTAHNTPLAKYLMRFPRIGKFAMRHLSRQLLKADGDTQAFLVTPQGKQLLHGCSKTDLAFINDAAWLKLMYQSMAEAFRQKSGVNAVVEEHLLFMKPWTLPFDAVGKGKLWIWHGKEDKTCRVENVYAIAQLVASAELEVFEGAGHFVMFKNLERLGKILRGEC
jgi:pimeloyl-ACP methyl ester carboxylesterase